MTLMMRVLADERAKDAVVCVTATHRGPDGARNGTRSDLGDLLDPRSWHHPPVAAHKTPRAYCVGRRVRGWRSVDVT